MMSLIPYVYGLKKICSTNFNTAALKKSSLDGQGLGISSILGTLPVVGEV